MLHDAGSSSDKRNSNSQYTSTFDPQYDLPPAGISNSNPQSFAFQQWSRETYTSSEHKAQLIHEASNHGVLSNNLQLQLPLPTHHPTENVTENQTEPTATTSLSNQSS